MAGGGERIRRLGCVTFAQFTRPSWSADVPRGLNNISWLRSKSIDTEPTDVSVALLTMPRSSHSLLFAEGQLNMLIDIRPRPRPADCLPLLADGRTNAELKSPVH